LRGYRLSESDRSLAPGRIENTGITPHQLKKEQMKNTVNINELNDQDAHKLLAHVIRQSGLNMNRKAETAIPEDGLKAIYAQLSESLNVADEEPVSKSPSLQALGVIVSDPLLKSSVQNYDPDASYSKEKTKQFSWDATTILTSTTLALVVLNSYLNIEKDKDGKWTFQFQIKPSSDGIKKELLGLIKSLITVVPDVSKK
jgi:hypothetical protein